MQQTKNNQRSPSTRYRSARSALNPYVMEVALTISDVLRARSEGPATAGDG